MTRNLSRRRWGRDRHYLAGTSLRFPLRAFPLHFVSLPLSSCYCLHFLGGSPPFPFFVETFSSGLRSVGGMRPMSASTRSSSASPDSWWSSSELGLLSSVNDGSEFLTIAYHFDSGEISRPVWVSNGATAISGCCWPAFTFRCGSHPKQYGESRFGDCCGVYRVEKSPSAPGARMRFTWTKRAPRGPGVMVGATDALAWPSPLRRTSALTVLPFSAAVVMASLLSFSHRQRGHVMRQYSSRVCSQLILGLVPLSSRFLCFESVSPISHLSSLQLVQPVSVQSCSSSSLLQSYALMTPIGKDHETPVLRTPELRSSKNPTVAS